MSTADFPAASSSFGVARTEIKSASGQRFLAQARLMVEPCLWCWEIRNWVDGELITSSWTDEWVAYDSSEEALLAAGERGAELDRFVCQRDVDDRSRAPPRTAVLACRILAQ